MSAVDLTRVDVWPIDRGQDCMLLPEPDGSAVLLVRPYPPQPFDAAVEKCAQALDCPRESAAALLRPHFPPEAHDGTGDMPTLGEPDAAKQVRRQIAHTERSRRIYWSVILILASVIAVAVTAVTSGGDGGPSVEAPLTRGHVVAALDAWDVDCPVNNGWAATCTGDVTGTFALEGLIDRDGVLVSSVAGFTSVRFYMYDDTVAGHAAAENQYEHLVERVVSGGGDASSVVYLEAPQGHGDLILFGDMTMREGLAAKGEQVGWERRTYTGQGAPTAAGAPQQSGAG